MAERLLKIIVVLSILIVLPFHIGHADEMENNKELWRDLNHSSDTILRYVKEGKYGEAKQLLHQFSNQFLSIRATDHNITMSELHVITSVYEEVEEATTSVSLSHQDRVRKASKLRILVDVYEPSQEPLWKKTEISVMKPIEDMKKAVSDGNGQTFHKAYSEFIRSYEIVRPAWSVSLPYEIFQKLEAHIKYLEQVQGTSKSTKMMLEHMDSLEVQIQSIYDEEKEEVSDPSLIWVMLTIGGSILLGLTYAGWKKYKGEKEREIQRYRKKRG
ncbi:sporulation protein YpjB [Evansella sp. AB-rgal1]|uniref:sporulation protein YpjB n=1 Tax=Evansella sp. AB-rgal1 TaxID=3242696 RepID=UPI00359CD7D1